MSRGFVLGELVVVTPSVTFLILTMHLAGRIASVPPPSEREVQVKIKVNVKTKLEFLNLLLTFALDLYLPQRGRALLKAAGWECHPTPLSPPRLETLPLFFLEVLCTKLLRKRNANKRTFAETCVNCAGYTVARVC
jgi:hypothetical protein